MHSETTEWPASTERPANAMRRTCEKCGGSLALVAELPAIRLHPLLGVYKCTPCNQITTLPP
jgi:hypothetical protein